MTHQPGWIELYNILERGGVAQPELLAQCLSSRSSIGETMLHWYAIEGEPKVLQSLIDLGFSVNVQNEFGNTPIMECSQVDRWDYVRVLLENGADLSIRNGDGQDYFEYLSEYGTAVPGWVSNHF